MSSVKLVICFFGSECRLRLFIIEKKMRTETLFDPSERKFEVETKLEKVTPIDFISQNLYVYLHTLIFKYRRT